MVEEAVLGWFYLDAQAFAASGADVDGFELAALYTLQHGLAGHTEGVCRFLHGEPTRWCLVDEQGAQFAGHADAPRGARCELFAGNEAVGEPPVHGGRRNTEFAGGIGDRHQVAVGRVGRRLVAGDVPVVAQTVDAVAGEPFAGGGPAPLAVEDPGDGGVGVVDRQATEQGDGVLVGADREWVGAGQFDGEFGDRAASPAHGELGSCLVASDVDDHVFEQAAQKFFAVPISGGRRRPDPADVVAERGECLAFIVGEGPGAGRLAAGEFGFGGAERGQFGFPVGFEAACTSRLSGSTAR